MLCGLAFQKARPSGGTGLSQTTTSTKREKEITCCGAQKRVATVQLPSMKLILLYFAATKQGADQYILNTQSMVWTAARDYCRTHYTDLTSLRNDAEYQIVQQVANGNEVYVGLFRDPWVWSGQTDSSFRYWNPDETVWTDGTQNCVAMLKVNSGKWGERACTKRHPFVCEYQFGLL
uniref:C-type lectin domain-containing protein n=1 Tax=Neolamprologus brichardi TaxID=32507 RepID=A0A3Q4HAV3_NEOBR